MKNSCLHRDMQRASLRLVNAQQFCPSAEVERLQAGGYDLDTGGAPEATL